MRADRAVAAAIGVILLGAAAFTGDGLRDLDQVHPKLGPDSNVGVIAASGPSPAQAALTATLTSVLQQTGTRAPIADGVIDPVGAQTCTPAPGAITAALARTTSIGDAQVTLSAYRAGLGASAFVSQRATLAGCDRVVTSDAPGLGIAAVHAQLGASHAVIWRRGDVIAAVTAPTDPSALARTVDTALEAALTDPGTRCAAQDSTVADTVRSPLGTQAFTGLIQTFTVTPSPAAQALLVSADAPGGDTALPDVDLPRRPADPVWPAALPAKVTKPHLPDAPKLPTATVTLRERVADPVGPGCGWTFLRESAPPFDAANAAQVLAEHRLRETARLDRAAYDYAGRVGTYRAALTQYASAATAWRAYAADVEKVATAWRTIRQERYQYNEQLRAYNDAVAARDAFLAAQAEAATTYQQLLDACANQPAPVPTPPVIPAPTTQPTPPTGTPLPSPTGTAPSVPDPTATSGATSPAQPTPRTPACPPHRPSILDENAPTVPPAPTPPADPRPENAR